MPTNSPYAGTGYEACSFGDALQECVVCGVLTVDARGEIVASTPHAMELLGVREAPSGAATAASLPLPLQTVIREAQDGGQPVIDRAIVLSAKDGATAGLLVTAVPVSRAAPDGGVAVLLKDLSSLEKLETDIRRLDRLASIGTLSASMAHEIKNAMVPVRTFVGLLLEKHPDAELAGTVRREMERVDAMVGRMLKFAGPAKPAFSQVRLHEILEHSLRLVQHRTEGKLISFQRRFGAASDTLHGDDHQLEQAFVNLLLNAVESMGSEGALSVATEVVGGEAGSGFREGKGASSFLRASIADTGMGIAPEHLDSIFDPFFTTKPSGTGLGLAVTRSIIDEHNGFIRVESQPGKGTTFTVLLPRPEAAAP
jgi:signal transduction histidine kinase